MPLDLLHQPDRDPAECIITVDGDEISELYPFLSEARVVCGRNEAATASLSFDTRRDELGSWTVQDAGILEPWKRIIITSRFGSREEEVMRGYIREVRLETPQDAGAAQVVVECQDDSLRLDRTHQRRTWGTSELPTCDTLVLSEILASYGLLPHPENDSGQNRLVGVAQDDTDIKFLKSRAEFNGYELIFREGQVYFGPMRLEACPQATVKVYAGEASNCLSLSVWANGHQPDAVSYDLPSDAGNFVSTPEPVRSNLFLLGTSRADSSDAGLEDFVWRLSGQASADAERLRALAQMKANELDMQRIQGEGELDGALYGHVLKPGLPVPVDGLGERMSGIYYVESVSHSFSAVGYRQQFRLLRNGYGDTLDAVSGLMRSLAGVI